MNACLTLIGEDYLYALLHRQLGEEALREREKLLGLLEEEPLRLRVQTALARLGKRTGTDLAEVLFHPETFALGGKSALLVRRLRRWRRCRSFVLPAAGGPVAAARAGA